MPISAEAILEDVARLVAARGPSGQEDEVDTICQQRLEAICDEVSADGAGNLIGLVRGKSRQPGIKVMAHKDELSLYVKRIEGDGRLVVRPVGGMTYWRFGDGPVDILTDDGDAIPGVVGRGPRHTAENPGEPRNGSAPTWEAARVNTRLSKDELIDRGVHAGSRVVIGRSRRELFHFADCVGGYFLDDRACIAVMLAAGEALGEAGQPPCDVYLICTSVEEAGGGAAAYAASKVPGDIVVALEVAPAAPEYEVPLDATPVIVIKDAHSIYTSSVCRALARAGGAAGTGYRYATFDRYGSDASCSRHVGNAAQIGCLGSPTDNTHGFEVCVPEGLANCARLLSAYLKAGGAVSP